MVEYWDESKRLCWVEAPTSMASQNSSLSTETVLNSLGHIPFGLAGNQIYESNNALPEAFCTLEPR